MHQLAQAQNHQLEQAAPAIYSMLSELGKDIYYIREGILSQSGEAKRRATRYNATLGTAVENGQAMHLAIIQDTLSAYDPKDIYEYAPTAGKPELRRLWLEKVRSENPSLADKNIGLPIVTTGLTHGLSLIADLLADENDAVITPDKIWENYEITFGVRRKSRMVSYPFYNVDGSYNLDGLRKALAAEQPGAKAIVVLNFPNNPTGYMPSPAEGEAIAEVLLEAADQGLQIVALVDDAYFGLWYEKDTLQESLFARLVHIHPSILPVRVDGATKEDYATGLRVGFLTFATEEQAAVEVLEQKVSGLIRASISSGPHPSQTFVLRALQSPHYAEQKQNKKDIIQHRARRAKAAIQLPQYEAAWSLYPFNSGYFLCLRLKTVQAEQLRRHLLDHYQVGTIALNDTDLRLAVPCIDEEDWDDLVRILFQAVKEVEKESTVEH
ncbi:aminotransferase class I/II-fold pyridoxal phosphate-dependent enzyme [Paenibacillus jiagnxiensis]|uniref:aminotransferase class I/II-fold pyridoxal phosphate-dependent enzyme n=1 Tax=Paenibacillus jiagnxiensis TaxID=3228926 RepID=UPI0033ADDBDF